MGVLTFFKLHKWYQIAQSISYVEIILSKFAGKNIVRKNVALI